MDGNIFILEQSVIGYFYLIQFCSVHPICVNMKITKQKFNKVFICNNICYAFISIGRAIHRYFQLITNTIFSSFIMNKLDIGYIL